MRDVVEADGVVIGDCAVSREGPPPGEDVPSLESLFFDFEDLFGSLVRESCSCWSISRLKLAVGILQYDLGT